MPETPDTINTASPLYDWGKLLHGKCEYLVNVNKMVFPNYHVQIDFCNVFMAKLNYNLLGGTTVVMVGGQFHLLQVSELFWWIDHEY